MKISLPLSWFLIALILFPVWTFLFKISTFSLPSSSEWLWVLCSTLAQASLSAFISIFLGILGALGLCALSTKKVLPSTQHRLNQSVCDKIGLRMSAVEFFCLLPALLPPLVTVLAYINVSEWFFRFPFSFYTVLGVHVLMNTGLSSVFFFRLLKHGINPLSAYAFLHGAGRWFFLKTLLLFEFRKDLLLLFLLIFAFCWTSFSVPLLVGGTSGQTIEVFMAEKLKNPISWPEAMTLFILETALLFIFFLILYGKERTHLKTTVEKDQRLYLLPAWPFIALPALPTLLILLGLAGAPIFFLKKQFWTDIGLIKADIVLAWAQSFLVGLGTGFVTFAGLSLVAFCLHAFFLRRFLLAYTGASTAFMGFSFLLLGTDSPIEVWLKWILGLSLLFLPALYRLGGEALLVRLKEQAQTAQLMGAKQRIIFSKIIYPQCQNTFWFLSGIAGVWAVGDFAYSAIVSGGQTHLALLIQDLLAVYRLELATFLTWLLILTGSLCFFIFNQLAQSFRLNTSS